MWTFCRALFFGSFVTAFSTDPSKNIKNDDRFYLAGQVSSPQRYADALNMTLHQVAERKENHRQALARLNTKLQSTNDGHLRHQIICEHRIRYGHHPFVCPNCWSYLPVCVCQNAAVKKNPTDTSDRPSQSPIFPSLPSIEKLHPKLQVMVWLHHKEWGLTSNTGGLLRLSLGENRCKLMMKGLLEHDNQLQRDYMDHHPNDKFVVVLWPSNESHGDVSSVTLEDLRLELSSPSRRQVVIMAVDGTWRNARRMVGRLPSEIPRLNLPSHVVKSHSKTESDRSLLAPLRRRGPSQRKHGDDSMVCTAEAVAMVLMELGMDTNDGEAILNLARTKVSLVRQYRGHDSTVG